MSYDGGFSIFIVNNTLLHILKKYKNKGAFDESIADLIGKKYQGRTCALKYINVDCAYITGCPKNKDEVFSFMWELIEYYSEGGQYDKAAFRDFITDLNNNETAIDKDYQYIEYNYYPADYRMCDFKEEHYLYDTDKGIDEYRRR